MSGTLTYWVRNGGDTLKALRLTVCSDEDLLAGDLASQRRRRLRRIAAEAVGQGARLSYRDLCIIMLSSRATLKRDVGFLRRLGVEVPLGGRGR